MECTKTTGNFIPPEWFNYKPYNSEVLSTAWGLKYGQQFYKNLFLEVSYFGSNYKKFRNKNMFMSSETYTQFTQDFHNISLGLNYRHDFKNDLSLYVSQGVGILYSKRVMEIWNIKGSMVDVPVEPAPPLDNGIGTNMEKYTQDNTQFVLSSITSIGMEYSIYKNHYITAGYDLIYSGMTKYDFAKQIVTVGYAIRF